MGDYFLNKAVGKAKKPLILLMTIIILFGGGCGGKRVINSDSPVPIGYTVSVANKGSENSQCVLVKIQFDKAIVVNRGAQKDFRIFISGQPIDETTMDYRVTSNPDNNRILNIEIYALANDTNPDQGKYFALYDGNLSITAKNKSGISRISDEGGKASVKWQDIDCLIPSGLTLKTIDSVTGNAATGTRAKVVVEVTRGADVRVISWIQFLSNDRPVMKEGYTTNGYKYKNQGSFPLHAHQFMSYSREDYAGEIVNNLKEYFGQSDEYTFTCDGNRFAVEAKRAVNDERLEVKVYFVN